MYRLLRFTSAMIAPRILLILALSSSTAAAQGFLNGGTAMQGNGAKRLTVTPSGDGSSTMDGLLTPPGNAEASAQEDLPDGTYLQSRRRAPAAGDNVQSMKDAAELFDLFGRKPQAQPPYSVSRAALGLTTLEPPERPLLVAGRIFSSAAQAASTRSRVPSSVTADALLSGPSVAATIVRNEDSPERLKDRARAMFDLHRTETLCIETAAGEVVRQAICGSRT